MTIYDIAAKAGVSASTVSRVINARPGIKKATRERVEKIIRESNFSVSEAARGLVNQTSRMIGILVSDIRNQHHTEGAYMIEQHFLRLGYCSMILNAGEDPESMAGHIMILASRRVEAAVLIGSVFQNALVEKAVRDYMPHIPVIFQNGEFSLPNVSSVLSDDEEGTFAAVRYLHIRGRRSAAYVSGPETPSGSRKISGYLRACGECGQDELLYFCDGTAEGGADVTEKLLAEHPETDAVVYAFDLMAVSGSRRILDAGRRIPDDIAVMGTDNSPFSSLANPRLSTIDTRLQELSSLCSVMLERALSDPSFCEKKIITPSLVLRETT